MPISVFVTPFGHFQWHNMPFGIRNAPATISRLVSKLLLGLDTFCAAYLDIIIFSDMWEEHLSHLRTVLSRISPFPQIDIIGAVVIVWRVRGKTIRSVLRNIVCNNCAQCNAHTYEQTNSSLDWVLSHWAHYTVLRFIFVLCITVCCMHASVCNTVRWTWWD